MATLVVVAEMHILQQAFGQQIVPHAETNKRFDLNQIPDGIIYQKRQLEFNLSSFEIRRS